MDTKGKTTVRVSAIVTRADGTVEDLGVIAEVHPLKGKKRLLEKLKGMVKGNG